MQECKRESKKEEANVERLESESRSPSPIWTSRGNPALPYSANCGGLTFFNDPRSSCQVTCTASSFASSSLRLFFLSFVSFVVLDDSYFCFFGVSVRNFSHVFTLFSLIDCSTLGSPPIDPRPLGPTLPSPTWLLYSKYPPRLSPRRIASASAYIKRFP